MAVMHKSPNIKVTVVDINKKRIDQWNGDVENLPIFEPGLSEIVKNAGKNLFSQLKLMKQSQAQK